MAATRAPAIASTAVYSSKEYVRRRRTRSSHICVVGHATSSTCQAQATKNRSDTASSAVRRLRLGRTSETSTSASFRLRPSSDVEFTSQRFTNYQTTTSRATNCATGSEDGPIGAAGSEDGSIGASTSRGSSASHRRAAACGPPIWSSEQSRSGLMLETAWTTSIEWAWSHLGLYQDLYRLCARDV
jgi:hypothetical protein